MVDPIVDHSMEEYKWTRSKAESVLKGLTKRVMRGNLNGITDDQHMMLNEQTGNIQSVTNVECDVDMYGEDYLNDLIANIQELNKYLSEFDIDPVPDYSW